jgi:hypothetical protein
MGDFKLCVCTTELILAPVTPRAEDFLCRPPDASAAYYRALIVEKEKLLKFAEHARTAGLSISFTPVGGDRNAFKLFG